MSARTHPSSRTALRSPRRRCDRSPPGARPDPRHGSSDTTLYPAVLVSAWYGGLGPAVCASLTGAVASTWIPGRAALPVRHRRRRGLGRPRAVPRRQSRHRRARRRHAPRARRRPRAGPIPGATRAVAGDPAEHRRRRDHHGSARPHHLAQRRRRRSSPGGRPTRRSGSRSSGCSRSSTSTREKTPNPAQRALAEGRWFAHQPRC